MPRTPDRHPGPLEEDEEIRLGGDAVGDPTDEGRMRYVSGAFRFRDSTGVYDPRSGGGGITEAQHKVLRQLIHFIDDGPAEGFASGAYKETVGTPWPSSETWYTASDKLHKIVELTITRDAAQKPTTEVWKVWDAGDVLLATITDVISYTGIFETSRTRTIA